MELPAFEFIEACDGYVNRTFSFGNRIFQQESDNAPYTYAFSIHKDSAAEKLQITICSPFLRQMLTFTNAFVLDFPDIASQYSSLQANLCVLEDPDSAYFSSENAMELRLLIGDFLLDRYMFSGFNLQHFYDQGIISPTYWQDMQHRSAMNDLGLVDDAFQGHLQRKVDGFDNFDCESPPDIALDHSIQVDEACSSTQRMQREDSTDSSLKVPSEEYHILKAIRRNLDKIPFWHEGWEFPTNIENSFKWCLDSACYIGPKEQEFLDHVIADDQDTRQLKALICHPGLKDVTSLYGISIIFEDWGEHQLNSANLSLDPAFGSVRRLWTSEKADLITQRLHEAFRAEDRRFRDEIVKLDLYQQSVGYANPSRFIYQPYHKAWDKGIATIRRILQGKRPNTLEKICRLLQVAYAMGSQDPSNTVFRTTFMKDLDRWRTIVPIDSLRWFDAITGAVWNKTFEEVESNMVLEYGSDVTLLQLQELLSGLISHYPRADLSETEEQQDHQVVRNEPSFNFAPDISYTAIQEVLGEMKDPRAYPGTRKLPIGLQPADPTILLIMIGAIFGFIFSFFVILQSSTIPTLAALVVARQDLHFTNFEERNLYIFSVNMGLSYSTDYQEKQHQYTGGMESLEELESIQLARLAVITEPTVLRGARSQTKTRQLQCGRCDKKFSNMGNLNRHMRCDCNRKAQFECRNPGCRMVASRKAYRDKHEVLRCPLRWNGGQGTFFLDM